MKTILSSSDGRARGVLLRVLIVALAFFPGSRISAAIVLMEGFQYANGDLMGLRGGIGYDGSKWTSNWYGGGADQFMVVSEAVRTGWSGASHATASRNFTSTVPPGTTMYFSTVMNQVGNEGDYEFDWGFADPDVGLSMRNDEWRLKLGGSMVTTTGAAVPHATDFRIVGRLEFNVAGNDDRLTMWVAPVTQPMSESSAHMLQITADSGQDTLGGVFRLRRLHGVDSAKQWADVRIATDFASVAAGPPQPAPCLEEHFAYSNGDLHGRNGGIAAGGAGWLTAWNDDDYGVGTDMNGVVRDFYVQSEVAGMTQSGGANRTIAREFDSNTADGTTMYFSAMMGKPDTESGYEVAYRFGDAGSSDRPVTVGIWNDQFRIRLGGTTATAPEKTVVRNQYDVLVGRLEFDVDGTAERLSYWANPNFESDEPILQLTQDLGTLSLGNLVDLWYGPGSDGAKYWDDLRIGTDFQGATRLRVDIGPNGQQVESGFQTWDTGFGNGTNGVDVLKEFTQLSGFTARLEGDADGGVDVRDRGSRGGLLDALKRDGVKVYPSFRLYFDDLDQGLYELTTYHHDSLDPIGSGMVDIFVNDADTPVVTVGQTGDAETPASATFRFETDPSGSVYFRFVGGEVWLSGFELTAIKAVPEPSTPLLAFLGLSFLIASRRRHRRAAGNSG